MEEWRKIEEFPRYEVSNEGRVRNGKTGNMLALSKNQQGIIKVGIVIDRKQYTRSVTKLVAEAFLPSHAVLYTFDTPINLDGDRSNNRVENLMWRPRWFAVKYHMQFKRPSYQFHVPIREIKTGAVYKNSRDAAMQCGLLEKDIVMATQNRTWVFPTYQIFELLHD